MEGVVAFIAGEKKTFCYECGKKTQTRAIFKDKNGKSVFSVCGNGWCRKKIVRTLTRKI